MMHKVLVITEDEFALGFQLSQIETRPVRDSQSARIELLKELDASEYGIVLIDEELTRDFDEKIKKRIFASEKPMVMQLPLKRELKEERLEDEFLEFITHAIGFNIRIV